ncbi:MAG: GHKL domain-containing protein [Actinobacteria bacterium]|nr:GHKL domain-containing protein [Actinomycetota bacterium]
MNAKNDRLNIPKRYRTTAVYILLLIALASVWSFALFTPLNSALEEREERHFLATAQTASLVVENIADPEPALDRLARDTGLRISLVDSTGQVLIDTAGKDIRDIPNSRDPEILSALQGRIGLDRRAEVDADMEVLHVAVPVSHEGETAALRVSETHDEITAILASAQNFGLFLLAAVIVSTVILVIRLTQHLKEPLERLTLATKDISAGNLSVSVRSEDAELAPLSEALAELKEYMKIRFGELQSERQNLRIVLDGLADAVFLLEGEIITFANSAAGRIFRTPVAGWAGQSIASTPLPTSVVSAVLSTVTSATKEHSVTECGPDASGAILKVSVTPLQRIGEPDRTLVVISDITERVRTERLRRDFVANASHELKTPVATMQLLAETTRDAAKDNDIDQALAFAAQIADESRRLGRLVTELLNLSRLESTPAPDTVTDIRQAASNAFAGHRVTAAQKGLTLEIDDAKVRDEDLYVNADPTDLAIIFDNLLDNAVNYTIEGGVKVILEADNANVRISFIDSGIGIPQEDIPRIFERFYRVDRARSRATGSTGLGLSLVRNVVERSKGSLEVISELGKGSTFVVILPRVN